MQKTLNRQRIILLTLLIISTLSIFHVSCLKESNLDILADTTKIAKIYQPDGIIGKDVIIESITSYINKLHIISMYPEELDEPQFGKLKTINFKSACNP